MKNIMPKRVNVTVVALVGAVLMGGDVIAHGAKTLIENTEIRTTGAERAEPTPSPPPPLLDCMRGGKNVRRPPPRLRLLTRRCRAPHSTAA